MMEWHYTLQCSRTEKLQPDTMKCSHWQLLLWSWLHERWLIIRWVTWGDMAHYQVGCTTKEFQGNFTFHIEGTSTILTTEDHTHKQKNVDFFFLFSRVLFYKNWSYKHAIQKALSVMCSPWATVCPRLFKAQATEPEIK